MNNFGPPIRARSDPYPGVINRPGRSTPIGPNHTVPYGTVPVFARIPGNKLPGYFHSVPTGQRHLIPVLESGARSNGAMEQWSNGAMEQWSNGAMEQWSNGVME